MRRSKAITLTLLGSAMLSAGCGGSPPTPAPAAGRVFYDKARRPVPRAAWFGPDGEPVELFDENGNPVPPDEVRRAAAGTATSTTTTTTTHRRSAWVGPVFYTPSGYVPSSPLSGPPARRPPSPPGSTYYGGSRPGGSGPSGGSSPSPGGGAVSRGGFGGTGAAAS
jgi:hypothetical protein